MEPLLEHIEAIKTYCIPTNIRDMGLLFALVEQLSPFYAVMPQLAPFGDLQRKNSRFYWDENLQNLFDKAKQIITKKAT